MFKNAPASYSRVLGALLFLLSAGPCLAGEQFGGFREFVDGDSIRPFARDLGGVLGAAAFHTARPLGFSGFDVGAHGGMILSTDPADKVLRGAGRKAVAVPWVQGEIGLPFFDGFIRGVSFQGLTIAGGGLRLGLNKGSDKPFSPRFLATCMAHSVVHRDFSASHAGADLVASFAAAWFTPYAAIGVDRTSVLVRASDRDSTLPGSNFVAYGARATAGFELRPYKYLYLQAAYTNVAGRNGVDTGLGVRF
jgi:hypothetical protein